MNEVKVEPGVTVPYVNVVVKDDRSTEAVHMAMTSNPKLGLVLLYLLTGRFTPDVAKRLGAFIGPCTKDGMKCDFDKATHYGFTGGDHTEMEAAPGGE